MVSDTLGIDAVDIDICIPNAIGAQVIEIVEFLLS